MKTLQTITRSILSLALTLAFLATSTASLVHEISHVERERSAAACHGVAAHDHGGDRIAAAGHTSGAGAESGTFCFFCTNGPSLLLLVALALLTLAIVGRGTTPIRHKTHVLSTPFHTRSSRAPPVLHRFTLVSL